MRLSHHEAVNRTPEASWEAKEESSEEKHLESTLKYECRDKTHL
ncbi:hypothetical protein PP707_06995 [Acetobacter pasteurianus]|nr:hypothetical protein [Acetobacter pasteurianus]